MPESTKVYKATDLPDDNDRLVSEGSDATPASPASDDADASSRNDVKVVTQNADEMKRIQAVSSKKRAGISAEVVSQEQVDKFVKPVYEKTKAEEEKITSIVTANEKMKVLMGTLTGQALQDVINAFFPKNLVEGDCVIKQGDEGDCLYLCEEGDLDIFVARPGPDGKIAPGDKGAKVVTLGPGALFGELALMYTAPRAATAIVASKKAKLWALEREAFKMLLVQTGQQTFQMYEGWLKDVDILKSLNQHELSALADSMESNLYDTDETIIFQGDPGECFYIVEDGTCSAFISGPVGEIEVKTYSQGDYFGEIALLTNEPRRATVRATGQGCTAIFISKEDFTSMLGPLHHKLKENIDKYPRYAEILKTNT